MKHHAFLKFSVLGLALGWVGCASDKPSTSADMPPPATTQTEPSSDHASASSDSASVDVPMDNGEILPLEKLPSKKGYPYAIKTKWPGLVKSPYAQDKTLVDVSTIKSGNPARCPHTGKIFIVP